VISGLLVERPDDPVAVLRQQVLRRRAWYPAPDGAAPVPCPVGPPPDVDGVERLVAVLRTGLDGDGVVVVALDRQLGSAELVVLATGLGTPQQQLDPRLQPWVEDGVILHLRADEAESDDRAWRLLFTEGYVMFHTELAGRPIALQPRHLLFQCVDAPDRDAGGQTLLAPMDAVRARLTDRQAGILAATRHAGFADPPTFLSRFDGRDVVTYKDAEGEPLPWEHLGDDPTVTAAEVEDALRALQAAVYHPAGVRGIPWERHLLAAFDNRRFLHGRACSPPAASGAARYLREVRVFAGDPAELEAAYASAAAADTRSA
jgi:hypothetical protein